MSKLTSRLRNAARLAALGVIATSIVVAMISLPTPSLAQNVDDYFVNAFGDPMDFSNTEDLVINTNEAMFVGGANKSISGGQLHFDVNGAFAFDLVWPGFATGMAHGREGGRVPIDAARYSRLVIRMNAPAVWAWGFGGSVVWTLRRCARAVWRLLRSPVGTPMS